MRDVKRVKMRPYVFLLIVRAQIGIVARHDQELGLDVRKSFEDANRRFLNIWRYVRLSHFGPSLMNLLDFFSLMFHPFFCVVFGYW